MRKETWVGKWRRPPLTARLTDPSREGAARNSVPFSSFQKFKEEARRRRSKSQFFDMIQEMRKIVRQQNEAKPPSWEDSRQRLTAASPPQWARDELHDDATADDDDDDDDEEEDDDDDESTMRLRSYLSSLRDSTKVSVLLKTCQYPHEEPESLVGSSSSYGSDSHATGEFARCRPRLSASMGDLGRNGEEEEPDLQEDYLMCSRSADDLRNIESDEQVCPPSLGGSRNSATWRTSSTLGLDYLRLLSLDKEEILRLWQSSERVLLNRLQDTLREKRLLEQKLLFVQRTLLKPP